jgi:hypothetical protein
MRKIISRFEYYPPVDLHIVGYGNLGLFKNKDGLYYFYLKSNGNILTATDNEVTV